MGMESLYLSVSPFIVEYPPHLGERRDYQHDTSRNRAGLRNQAHYHLRRVPAPWRQARLSAEA